MTTKRRAQLQKAKKQNRSRNKEEEKVLPVDNVRDPFLNVPCEIQPADDNLAPATVPELPQNDYRSDDRGDLEMSNAKGSTPGCFVVVKAVGGIGDDDTVFERTIQPPSQSLSLKSKPSRAGLLSSRLSTSGKRVGKSQTKRSILKKKGKRKKIESIQKPKKQDSETEWDPGSKAPPSLSKVTQNRLSTHLERIITNTCEESDEKSHEESEQFEEGNETDDEIRKLEILLAEKKKRKLARAPNMVKRSRKFASPKTYHEG